MFRCATVRELSLVMAICHFCHFLIYISARFIYISFTFLFFSLYLSPIVRIYTMPFSPCHLCHLWQVIVFKRIFFAIALGKSCHVCHKNYKPLFLKGFFIIKCVMSLIYKYSSLIIITSHHLLYITTLLI